MNSRHIAPNLQEAFSSGTLELQGQFTLGSNYTFLVEISHQGQTYAGVYKPQKGEQPLWDFAENSLAGREVCAYRLSEFLGWSLVPYTILRADGPYGPGSLQQFIEYNPNQHYFNFKPEDKARLHPVALFDHLINNADRKGSHVLFEKRTRHLYAIDHGLCFHTEDKLRTVIWDFAGQEIAESFLGDIQRMCNALAQTSGLVADLEPYLTPEEIAALTERGQGLLTEGRFPQPPQYRRAFPYPPV
ncbi:MAG: hypothetical protein CVU44_16605 [Chloroflexi bacterium HGW-Chloroflexi-6]|nr:MAG: hypothetical protein CVU44_16605 [Chloroflexi bacterium HGW-Chloroflexi-6]